MATKKITRRPAGRDHQVLTIRSTGRTKKPYRREPCATCPWRVDAVGIFPAEAFRLSADVSYDMSQKEFSCHESGAKVPTTCAGFLLRTEHNLAVRLRLAMGSIEPESVHDGGHELHENYRAMAVANGVAPTDPILRPCR